MRHSKLTATEGIHTVIAYTYADAAARTGATGFTVEDAGKFAKQLDNGTIWMLTAYSPVTWASGAGSSAPLAHASTHLPGGSDALTYATPSDIGTANAAGTGINTARGDHVHNLPFSVVQTVLGGSTGSVGFNSQKLTNVLDPTAAQDAATKAYVDALSQGLDTKGSVVAVSTSNIASLSGLATTVDGVLLNTDSWRVLLAGQSTASQNGIYLVHSGAWTRSADMAAGSDAAGNYCFVEQGTSYADSGWVCTTNTGSAVVGTNSLAFTQFSGAGQITAGAGMTKTGNTLNVIANADGSIVVNVDDIQVGVITNTQHGSRGNGTLHTVATSTAAGFMPQSNFSATVDPAVGNDNTQGYVAGSIWHNATAGTVWHAISVATGAAVWKKLITTSMGFVNGGEAGGAARTLGNTDAYSLAFLTNNLQRLLINSDGSMLVTASTAASTAFAIKAAAAQTGDLLMFQNSSGTEMSCITAAGWLNIAGSTNPFPTSPLFVSLATNSYLQLVAQNTSTGTSASSDFVATADNGSDTTNFVDLGINGSAYNQAAYNIGAADDAYLLAVGGHLAVGTGTATKTIKFHTGGTTTTQLRATITDTALVMNTLPIQGVVDPTNAQDAATKAYVDANAGGNIGYKLVVAVATTANITLSGTQTIDGVAVAANNRVLVKNQTAGADNGIYVCSASTWSRATDLSTSAECDIGAIVVVRKGTVNAGTEWLLATQPAITLGSTALSFVPLTYVPLARQQFSAPDFDDPGTDWSVVYAAGLTADSVNAAVMVRRFDDTTQEGVGWSVLIPAAATQVRFTFMSKAYGSPSAPDRTVGIALKKREVPNNASLGAWASSTLSDLTITQDVYFHRASQTVSLSTLSLTADRVYQLELVRQGPSAGTGLVGDWCLTMLLVEWLP
jgi:hypothetical protein